MIAGIMENANSTSWQDVAREFGWNPLAQDEHVESLCKEIARLREGQGEFKNWQDARVKERQDLEAEGVRLRTQVGDSRIYALGLNERLTHSESKRAKLREALEWYAAGENIYQGPIGIGEGKVGAPFGTLARKALAADAAEDA